jgi:hypothetical protein
MDVHPIGPKAIDRKPRPRSADIEHNAQLVEDVALGLGQPVQLLVVVGKIVFWLRCCQSWITGGAMGVGMVFVSISITVLLHWNIVLG